MTDDPIDDGQGIPVPDELLPDGLVVTPATDFVEVPASEEKPAEPAEGEPG